MSSDLTPADVELIKGLLDRGESLPDRFKASLFADSASSELIWPGKSNRVETAVLPFQSIEHIDEPRRDTSRPASLFDIDTGTGRQAGGWTNKLIWGDNRLILSSLSNGSMRHSIEEAGGLKLVYIDPPFDLGADFSMDIEIGQEKVTKKPSVIEEIAYRDTWGRGKDSYLAMISERLALIRDLMAEDATLYVHSDWRVSSHLRLVLDEIFGEDKLRNEIVWCYTGPSNQKSDFPDKHDTIWRYVKSSRFTFNRDNVRIPYVKLDTGQTSGIFKEAATLDDRGKLVEDWWWDITPVARLHATELLGFPTQKPEKLLERILLASTDPGDLVADFFCGSGTTPAVAERLGRKWIAADLGRFAVHTTRKRLISVQRSLRSEGEPYRAFEVLNLGRYERQHFVGVDVNLPQEEQQRQSREREEAYLSLILTAYAAERATGIPPFHGLRGRTAVLVGPVDLPVTEQQVRDAIKAAASAGITRVDVLGFEFEMGVKPLLQDQARDQGVDLALRYIPNEVFDKRAVQKGDVKFYDVAYVEFTPTVIGRSVTVTLDDFAVFYRQDDAEVAAAGLRMGGSRVVIDDGQVVKVSKDRKGILSRELLTQEWTDWIDYWAVDFDYQSQPELVRVIEGGEERQIKTGRFVFENRWQSFRTRHDRRLELESAPYEYAGPGTYNVGIKVIDIFGNDTTRVLPIQVKG